ncbi:predicted protein [Plenodomus lingam JN3]|uniref:Predicted protein n=1 Tax=Leptosphaeria maculans (strain JN3 / isolate v23.1.3 / race Av1-4-5-6-7-8) TaxID=985895 RepID=E5AB66_LEPMJ|nr:predicted protein [Plenodomus lingam JN3]CBY00907.1 predicted protein [Plenodomus lingam JN3]
MVKQSSESTKPTSEYRTQSYPITSVMSAVPSVTVQQLTPRSLSLFTAT